MMNIFDLKLRDEQGGYKKLILMACKAKNINLEDIKERYCLLWVFIEFRYLSDFAGKDVDEIMQQARYEFYRVKKVQCIRVLNKFINRFKVPPK